MAPYVNSKGLSLVELLIAAAMTLVFVMGTTRFATVWKWNYESASASSVAVAVESALVAAVSDPDVYTQAVKDQLADDTVPNEFELQLKGVGDDVISLKSGETVFIGRDFKICNGFTEARCVARVAARIKNVEPIAGGPDNFGIAYNIEINPKYRSVPARTTLVQDTGVDPWDNNKSYSIKIPNLFYKQNAVGLCGESDLGVMGLDERDWGKVSCLKMTSPGAACASGQFPIGLQIKGDELGFKCSRSSAVPRCGDNYSVESFSTGDAFNSQKTATCLLATMAQSSGPAGSKEPLKYGAPNNNNIMGRVCPPYYRSISTCELKIVNSQNGTCYKQCCDTMKDADGNPVVDASGNVVSICNDCSTYPPPNKGSLRSANSDRDASCSYTPAPVQPCGGGAPSIAAVFEAYPVLTVKCVSTLPDQAGAQ